MEPPRLQLTLPGAGSVAGTSPSRSRVHGARAAYACYFLLGSGVLAPWNAFITAADYYAAVFPGRHVDRLFTAAYLPACLAMLALMLRHSSDHARGRTRILIAFVVFTAVMLGVPLVCSVRAVVGRACKTAAHMPAARQQQCRPAVHATPRIRCSQVDELMVGTEGEGSSAALALLLSAVVVVGVLDGLSQGAIFADAALLPPHYTHVSLLIRTGSASA
jgi:hypothetical protein